MAAGSIVLELLMKTGSFETDTKRAEKRLRELEKQAAAFGAAIGATASAGLTAFAYAAAQTVKSLDELGEAAERVSVTTEALSGLQYAAQLSAVSSEQLEQGLIKLSKAAADGNEAFDKMGVNVRDASGAIKSADVLLKELAARFATYKDGPEKTALAMELLGKSGAALVPLLNRGADGIERFTDEARAMGLVISGETTEAAGGLNDELDRIKGSLQGATNAIVADMLPALNEVALFTRRAQAEYGAFLGLIVGGVGGGALKALGQDLNGAESNFEFFARQAREAFTEYSNLKAEYEKKVASGGILAEFQTPGLLANMAEAKARYEKFVLLRKANKPVTQKEKEEEAPIVGETPAQKAERERREREARKREQEAEQRKREAAAELKRIEAEGEALRVSLLTPMEKLNAAREKSAELRKAKVISPETEARANQAALDEYQKYIDGQRDLLTRGLLTEEEEVRASYERRRAEILAITEATETEKQDALLRLEEQYDKQRHDAHLSRYRDLMTQETAITEEYKNRREAILNDSTLSAEKRAEYLGALQRKWSEEMNALDEADAKKRQELQQKNIDLVSNGFAQGAELAKAWAGENSQIYAAMFAASKAFAIADITIKQSQAIAKAWGENNYFVAAGLTVGLAAQFAGLISSAQGAQFGGTRADGGSVSPDRSYLVGERGPERFVPTQPGVILPNDSQSNTQGGGGNIRIVNAYDTGHIDEYMGSSSGERIIMNAVRRNGAALRQLVRTA